MVFCSKCGTQTDDGGVYCPNCGYQLTKEKQTLANQDLLSLVNLKAIIFGGIVAIPFFLFSFLIIAVIYLSATYSMNFYGNIFLATILYALSFPLTTFIGSFVSGYTSGPDSVAGMVNGLILAMIVSFFSFIVFIDILLGAVVVILFTLIAGAGGGLIGSQIKKRTA